MKLRSFFAIFLLVMLTMPIFMVSTNQFLDDDMKMELLESLAEEEDDKDEDGKEEFDSNWFFTNQTDDIAPVSIKKVRLFSEFNEWMNIYSDTPTLPPELLL